MDSRGIHLVPSDSAEQQEQNRQRSPPDSLTQLASWFKNYISTNRIPLIPHFHSIMKQLSRLDHLTGSA
jgi:hypothetical protein